MKNLTKKSIISLILTFIMIFNVVPFGAFTSVVNAAGEYDATIDDIDIGTVVEGFNQTDFYKNVKLTNTGTEPLVGGVGYMKIELTSGDTDAFGCDFRDSGYIPSTYRVDKASVYPKNGLTAGTYTATLTLSYDRDGNETAYSWEVLDTATVTVKVNTPTTSHNIIVENGTSDKSTASEGETVYLTAEPVNGNMAFSEWEVISGGITIINKDSFSTARFTMPNNEVRIRAKYVNLNYSATIGDVNVGTTGEGFNPNDFRKSVPFTNTGSGALDGGANYMKIEFTSGDIDAFGCDFINTGYILSGGTPNKAYVYPKTGLTAGTYTATLTLSYDRDGDETAYGWEELDTATITFKVNGSGVTKHTVTFYDGSTVLTTLTQQVNDGEKATKPEPDPTKTGGYAFINWYADALMTTPFDFANTSITKATPIYAKFVKQHTITFDSNGGSGSIPDIIVNDGTDFDFPTSSGFTAPGGKEFDKWEISGYGTYSPGVPFQPSTDLIVKAIWKDITVVPAQYTVTFNLNGGTMTSPTTVQVNNGEKVTKPTPNPTKTGLAFDNWYSDATFTTLFDFDTPIINPTPIYANWYGIITVNASTGGKVNINNLYFPDTSFTENVWEGKTMTLQAISDSGYKFVKWVKDSPTGTLVSTNANTSITVDSSKTYYAIFEPETPTQYTVTFINGNDSSTISTTTVNKNEKVTRPSDPTPPANYTFDNWYSDAGMTTPFDFDTPITAHTPIYAKFIPNSVTPQYAATVEDIDFGKEKVGYPDLTSKAKMIQVTNNGTENLNIDDNCITLSGDVDKFDILIAYNTPLISGQTKGINWIKPKNGLGIGTYTVIATFKDKDNKVTATANITFTVTDLSLTEHTITVVDGTSSKTSAEKNETITITADAAPSGKEFDKWVVEEGTITLANANSASTTFKMPDEAVKVKATYKDVAVTPTYTIESGANQTYTIDSNVDVVIKASGDESNLSKIQIDGTDLDTAHYNTEEGSTILTLKASYLNTLSVGEHTVKFVYNDGEVSTGLKVAQNGNSGNTDPSNPTDPSGNNTGTNTNNENNNTNTGSNTTNTTGTTENTSTNTSTNTTSSKTPKTGDNIVVWIALLVVATIGTVGTVKYLRKKD